MAYFALGLTKILFIWFIEIKGSDILKQLKRSYYTLTRNWVCGSGFCFDLHSLIATAARLSLSFRSVMIADFFGLHLKNTTRSICFNNMVPNKINEIVRFDWFEFFHGITRKPVLNSGSLESSSYDWDTPNLSQEMVER